MALLATLTLASAPGLASEEPPEGRKLDPARLQQRLNFVARLTNNMASAEIGGHRIDVLCGKLPAEAPEYGQLADLESGVVTFANASAMKLRNEATLQFGDFDVAAGNAAPGYPGLYSLWLAKGEGGAWRLVFNREADVWGTMHDASADVGEIPLAHETRPDQTSELEITIEEGAEAGAGLLVLQWGPHRWSAPFTVGG